MAERFRALHGRVGYWLRSFEDSGEGTLDGVLDTLLNPEFGNAGQRGTLCLKVADGTRYWSGTRSLADIAGLRAACHARGVAFLPVVLPRGPEAGWGTWEEQVAMHAEIARVCGCLMTDIEPYEGYWQTRHDLIPRYTERLRQLSGDAYLINQPDPREYSVRAGQVKETAKHFDALAPQHYVGWETDGERYIGWLDVSREVLSVQQLQPYTTDYYPTLWGLERVDIALRFWERVREQVEGANIFAFGAMNPGQLFAFGQMSRPAVEPDPLPGGPPPPEPEPEAEVIPPRIALRMGLGWGGAAIAQRMLDLEVPDAEAFGFVRGTALGLIDSIDAAGGEA